MNDLKTIDEKLAGLNYYPRMQLRRRQDNGYYLNLNGKWEYLISKSYNITDEDEKRYKEIIVPYPIESKLSKVGIRLDKDDYIVYKKPFIFIPKEERTILHIGACSSESIIFINNNLVGHNSGGYLPIDIDITDYLWDDGDNEIEMFCHNKLDGHLPYGKQTRKNGGIWYTPNSGIWKSVWLESVNRNYIKDLKIRTDLSNRKLSLNIDSDYPKYNIKVLFNNELVIEKDINSNNCDIKFDEIKEWSPDQPNLYDLIIENEYDRVESYFGFKEIAIKDKKILLNNKPIFMHGLLDQGYYPESLLSYPNIDCVINDLKKIKELGFNTLRKHIKVEDDIWYYFCDKLGIIVWQDFVNMFRYSFLFDSALPTVFSKRLDRIRLYSKNDKEFFINHSLNIMKLLSNHPSVALWTIFNEGWGQFDTNKVYKIIKKNNDSNLLIDSASGWFKRNKATEVVSDHVYFKKFSIDKEYDKPYLLSEFGGYALRIDGHTYNEKEFGYKLYKDLDSLNNAIYDLYHNEIIPNIKKGLCATIYTQVSDVEDEVNGIFTYDRKVCKLNKDIALKIKEEIDCEFLKNEKSSN